MRYGFIRAQERTHRVSRLCAALAVSLSGYYAWPDRLLSVRVAEDQQLLPILRQIHREMHEEYGAVKLRREARHRGIPLWPPSSRPAAEIRRARGPTGPSLPPHRRTPSTPPAGAQPSPAAIYHIGAESGVGGRCHECADASRLALCGGAPGFVFAPRDRLGHECSARSTADTGRLGHGGRQRRVRPGLIHHSDQGTQYTAWPINGSSCVSVWFRV